MIQLDFWHKITPLKRLGLDTVASKCVSNSLNIEELVDFKTRLKVYRSGIEKHMIKLVFC